VTSFPEELTDIIQRKEGLNRPASHNSSAGNNRR
jgi:hypothetical protein